MKEKVGRFVSIFWKFKYVITTAAFLVWMGFFDRQNYFYKAKLDREMETLVQDTLFYHNEISENTRRLNELNGDRAALEKLGREKYLMKKDDEDVFVIVNEGVNK